MIREDTDVQLLSDKEIYSNNHSLEGEVIIPPKFNPMAFIC